MEKELIIQSSSSNDLEIALVEDGKLVEIHNQRGNDHFQVGDIYLGRVKRLTPGMNAAFVEIGHPKDAFLHYTDLGPKLPSSLKFVKGALQGTFGDGMLDQLNISEEIQKSGRIDLVLAKRSMVLVQIIKEAISTKGPRLSCELTIAGRFLVLTPFTDSVSVSKKISNEEERKRLHVLVESIKPKNFGIIVRTAAEGKKVAELHEEIRELKEKWISIYENLKTGENPRRVLSEIDKTNSLLRDLLNDDFNKVVVDDKQVYDKIKSYLQNIAPEKAKILQLHKGPKPIFDQYSITKQIKSSFGKTSTMSSGAYIVIEHTEAMHVIDINSGPKYSNHVHEDAILRINLEAGEEIARQLRLRDIGGLIVCDFIDMKNNEHKRLLEKKMVEFMAKDRAQHTILPLSKFGLMQITRERAKPEINIQTAEVCPVCDGTGKVTASILIIDKIESDLDFIMNSGEKTSLILRVHPFVESYIKQGIITRHYKWFMKYWKWITVLPNLDFHIFEYKFFNSNDDEIRLGQ